MAKAKAARGVRADEEQDEATVELIDRLQAELDALRSRLGGKRSFSSDAERARQIDRTIRARRARERVLDDDIFADPGWDILLGLYHAQLDERTVTTIELCGLAAVPTATAIRWIEKLERSRWLTRERDPADGRKMIVELSKRGRAALDTYFESLGSDHLAI